MIVAAAQPQSISTTTSTLLPSTTGFDKIDLRLTDWQVQPDHELAIHFKGNHDQPTLLFVSDNKPVFGYGAHYKTNWWYLNIIVPRPGIRHCFLGFNASKFLNHINWPPATPQAITKMLPVLKRQLLQIGIEADIECAAVRRLELCSDIQVSLSPEAYWEVLSACTPPRRMKMRKHLHGVSWYNGSAKITAYAKHYQLKHEYGDAALSMKLPPENTIRLETTALTPDAVRRKLGDVRLSALNQMHKSALDWHHNTLEAFLHG